MRIRYGVGPVVAALLTAGAVTASAAPTLAAGRSPSSAAAVVQLASSPVGRVLVTGSGATSGAGMALYEFSGDAFPAPEPPLALLQFNCTASNTTTRFTSGSGGVACTTAWPPLMATGALVAGRGVSQNGLSVASVGSGFTPGQVEYFGHPLYTFVKDTPGTFNGEDIAAFGGIFWLVSRRWASQPRHGPSGHRNITIRGGFIHRYRLRRQDSVHAHVRYPRRQLQPAWAELGTARKHLHRGVHGGLATATH